MASTVDHVTINIIVTVIGQNLKCSDTMATDLQKGPLN